MILPRKRFGQHFLRDANIINRIITALAPKPHDHLIEIGPGQGALTFPMLKQVPILVAIELDRDLAAFLQANSKGEALKIYSTDALTFDFSSLKQDERKLRIFGNLPYNISTPLIFHLLDFSNIITDMLFMVQKEVADRLAAMPHTSDYGRLSVMVQYHCQVERLFDVPPSAFYPPPQVQSSVVRLIPYFPVPYLVKDEFLFRTIVKQAFSQRRKTLRNSLKNRVSDHIWSCVQVHSNWRAEDLSVKNFVEICNACSVAEK